MPFKRKRGCPKVNFLIRNYLNKVFYTIADMKNAETAQANQFQNSSRDEISHFDIIKDGSDVKQNKDL